MPQSRWRWHHWWHEEGDGVLPEELKQGVKRLARQRSCSEAEVIRQAIREAIARPKPRGGIIPGDSGWTERMDDYLDGFGER